MVKKQIDIYIGRNASLTEKCPTILTTNTPYIRWKLPSGVNQARYNLKIHSLRVY